MMNICYFLLIMFYFQICAVPPGKASLSTANETWVENRTYTVLCLAEEGQPESAYKWTVDGHDIKGYENSHQLQIQAYMELNGAILGCNVSNNYTIVKNTPKFETMRLFVECKLCFNVIIYKITLEDFNLTNCFSC